MMRYVQVLVHREEVADEEANIDSGLTEQVRRLKQLGRGKEIATHHQSLLEEMKDSLETSK